RFTNTATYVPRPLSCGRGQGRVLLSPARLREPRENPAPSPARHAGCKKTQPSRRATSPAKERARRSQVARQSYGGGYLSGAAEAAVGDAVASPVFAPISIISSPCW